MNPRYNMNSERKNSKAKQQRGSNKNLYKKSGQLQQVDIEGLQHQVNMTSKQRSKQVSSESDQREQVTNIILKPNYSKPNSQLKPLTLSNKSDLNQTALKASSGDLPKLKNQTQKLRQTVGVEDYQRQKTRQLTQQHQIDNIGSMHNINQDQSPVKLNQRYKKNQKHHLIRIKPNLLPRITEQTSIFSTKMRELIKVEQITDHNYFQAQTQTRQTSQSLIQLINLCSSDPVSLRQYIPPEEIRQQLKHNLSACQDQVNLRQLVSKQVTLVQSQIKLNNIIDQPQLYLHLATYLSEQANCLLDTGNYPQAITAYQKCTPILQNNFIQHSEQITAKSYLSKLKSWVYGSQQQQPKSTIQQSSKHLLNTYPLLTNSLNSLTKCYEITLKSKQRNQSIQKSISYTDKYEQILKSNKFRNSVGNIQVLINKANLFSSINSSQSFKATSKQYSQTAKKLQEALKKQKQPQKVVKVHNALIKIRQTQIQNGLKFSSEQFEKNDTHEEKLPKQLNFKKGKLFDDKSYKSKVLQCKQHYEKCIQATKATSKNCFQLFKTRNNYAQFLFETSNLSQSLEQSGLVLENSVSNKHTTGCFASLNIGKVSLARGNCKHAFQNFNRSYEILKDALLKEKDSKIYRQVLLRSQVYRQIELMRVKTYNIQMRHDLATKTLKFITPKNVSNDSNLLYLAEIYEEMGNTRALSTLQQPQQAQYSQDYITCFEQAISIRSRLDKNCIENGLAYCSIAKFLISKGGNDQRTNKLKKGYIQKAKQIFAQYQKNHPNNWALYLILSPTSQELQVSKKYVRNAVESVTLKYGKFHINTLRVRLHECFIQQNSIQKNRKLWALYKDLCQCIEIEQKQIALLDTRIKIKTDKRNLQINDEKNQVAKMCNLQANGSNISQSMLNLLQENSAQKSNRKPESNIQMSQPNLSKDLSLIIKNEGIQLQEEQPGQSRIGANTKVIEEGNESGDFEQERASNGGKVPTFEGEMSQISEIDYK